MLRFIRHIFASDSRSDAKLAMASFRSILFALILFRASSAIAPAYEGQTLKWQTCPSSLGFLQHTIQCAEVQVPLDYDSPIGADAVTVGVTRLPALTPKVWLLGISPIATRTHQRYRIASGTSSTFQEARETQQVELSTYPLLLLSAGIQKYGIGSTLSELIFGALDLVRPSSTINEKLSWLGQSGGTQLGERYAELYPTNVRAMILDAVVAQSQYGLAGFIENALSEDATMKQFFRWCEQQNATACPAANRNKTIEAVWTDLLARVEASPLPAPRCVPGKCVNDIVTAKELRNFARSALYKPHSTESGFATLAVGIYQAAFLDDATAAVVRVPSNSSPAYATAFYYATNVIERNHRINDDTLTSMRAKALEAKSSTPLFSGITTETVFESACIGWPTGTRNPPHPVDIPHTNTTLPVILIVSNLYDPGTPYSWGTKVQQEIGDVRTKKVTRIAAGHTVYFQPEAYNGKTVGVMVRKNIPEIGFAVTN